MRRLAIVLVVLFAVVTLVNVYTSELSRTAHSEEPAQAAATVVDG